MSCVIRYTDQSNDLFANGLVQLVAAVGSIFISGNECLREEELVVGTSKT